MADFHPRLRIAIHAFFIVTIATAVGVVIGADIVRGALKAAEDAAQFTQFKG